MYDAVLFDMDGLLLDTERVYADAYIDLAAARGIAADPQSFLRMVGLTRPGTLAVLAKDLGSAEAAEVFYTDWGAQADAQLRDTVPVKPGVRALLDQLSELPKAVVTSSRHAHAQRMLTRAGLIEAFDTVIGGDMVPRPKPDPAPYLMGAEALGVPITRCAAFEDSATGIRAAVASGARAVQVPDLVPVTSEIRALGHVIAPSLLDGARQIGLI